MKKLILFFIFINLFVLFALTSTQKSRTVNLASNDYSADITQQYYENQIIGQISDLNANTNTNYTFQLTSSPDLTNGTSTRPVKIYVVPDASQNIVEITDMLPHNITYGGTGNFFNIVFSLPGTISDDTVSYNNNSYTLVNGVYSSNINLSVKDNENDITYTYSFNSESYTTQSSQGGGSGSSGSTQSSPSTFDLRVSPMAGFYNINLGSDKYPSRTESSFTKNESPTIQWKNDNDKTNSAKYYDSQIIGIATIKIDNTESTSSKIIIDTRTMDNSYDFISQSNSNYRRPYEIWGVLKQGDLKTKGGVDVQKTQLINLTNSVGHIEFDTTYKGMWLDLILVLPDSNKINNMTLQSNGKQYYLADKNDYGTVVTIQFSVADNNNPNNTSSSSLVFPLQGYYHKETDTDTSAIASLVFRPSAAASNINLETGGDIFIGDLDFMIDRGKGTGAQKDSILFASSSPNPLSSSGEPFRFISETVGPDVTLNSANNITYTVIFKNNKTLAEREYRGTAYVDTTTFNATTRELSLGNSSDPIEYGVEIDKQRSTNLSETGTYNMNWSEYHGKVYINLNLRYGLEMIPGRYTSTIYIHCLAKDV